MGLQAAPAYIGSLAHPATMDRQIVKAVFGRTGAARLGQMLVSTGTGVRAIQVSPGQYYVNGVENAQQGGYVAWSDAAETFLLGAAVGNPRIDTLLLRIHDDQYGTLPGVPGAYYDIIQGVPGAVPATRPDSDFNVGGSFYIPGAWARIADVRVNLADASGIPTGQIFNTSRYSRTGGFATCTSTTRPGDAVQGDVVQETDTGLRATYNGSEWRYLPQVWDRRALLVDTATVTFSGIPSGVRSLKVLWAAKSADLSGNAMAINCRVNNVSTATAYYGSWTFVQGTTPNYQSTGASGTGQARVGAIPGGTANANVWGSGVVEFPAWNANTGHFINVVSRSQFWDTNTNNFKEEGGHMMFFAGPYNRLDFFTTGNFKAGSEFAVVVEG